MIENILKLAILIFGIMCVVICMTMFITKWLDTVYRNPESSKSLNIIGFTSVGLLEPALLALIGCIFLMVK